MFQFIFFRSLLFFVCNLIRLLLTKYKLIYWISFYFWVVSWECTANGFIRVNDISEYIFWYTDLCEKIGRSGNRPKEACAPGGARCIGRIGSNKCTENGSRRGRRNVKTRKGSASINCGNKGSPFKETTAISNARRIRSLCTTYSDTATSCIKLLFWRRYRLDNSRLVFDIMRFIILRFFDLLKIHIENTLINNYMI